MEDFIDERQRLMIMRDEARVNNKQVRLRNFAKKYGPLGYTVDATGEVMDKEGKFYGNFESFKPNKPRKVKTATEESEPIDKEAAFIESEVAEFDGPQPDATTQMELANYTSLADDVSAQPTSAGTNKTTTRSQLNIGPATGRAAMRAQNVERFGEARVAQLESMNKDFQGMKKGNMTKAEFIKKYPNSQTAKRAKIKIKKK